MAQTVPDGLVEVTKEQFFAKIGPLNVHPHIVGCYPYASEWRLQTGAQAMVGWSRDGGTNEPTRYYLMTASDNPR